MYRNQESQHTFLITQCARKKSGKIVNANGDEGSATTVENKKRVTYPNR